MHRLALPRVRSFAVAAAAAALVIGAVSSGTFVARSNDPAYQAVIDFGKHGNETKELLAGVPNEGPEDTYAAEQAALRAFPADEVPPEAVINSQNTFQSFRQSGRTAGTWSPIGPLSRAQYPGVLDQFLFDGAPFNASGRVTALAIAPSCTLARCRVYLGAAGGGVWATDRALSGSFATWSYLSGSLASNAVGSILIDPSDASGNTLYVGTGEPNASGDSEAGVGIYKSSDGGLSWSLVPGSGIFFQRSIGSMAFDNAGNLLVPIASGVRGVSSVTSGASSSAATGHPLATRGLYRQTGATFTLIRPIVSTVPRGSTTVKVDPTHAGVIYVNEFSRGIYRSVDNGATWLQIKTPLNATLSTDRAEFDVTTLPNGNTRMYVGVGNQFDSGTNRARFYVTDDASGAASFVDMTTTQNIGYCTAQCWYDNYVVTPAGSPDVVYLGGSYSYGQQHGVSNGRAVLLSTDGGTSFSDMTLDGSPSHAAGMHPDQHALVTVPGKPFQFIVGSDGGVMRSDGQFVDSSSKCDARGLSTAGTTFCKSLLSRVPNQLIDLNSGLDTLQFQSFSVSAQHPTNLLMGGTQDNGTFEYDGGAAVWPQIIYGDGGQSGFNAANDALRFNTFTGQANDANFQNGDPTKWVIISAPIISSPEGAFFYPPIVADPNPAAAGSIFQGSFSVWRTQDWGGDQATLEANCPEFTTAADKPGCGDFVRIGDAVTDLTAASWGSRTGGAVAWIARTPQNIGTMWVATSTGRVFVTDNANASANLVHWTRLDAGAANSPTRAISGIYVDPANPDRAWISYNGYNINNPTQPGHVFEVVRSGSTATWTDRSYDLADLPATALVRDDLTGDLYVGTDFGVLRLTSAATSWTLTGGMPAAEVAGLTIVPSSRVLYAATHGFGGWVLDLGKIK
ncbi:MAG TPA: hypothetical protein VNC22_02700 [Sporichthya sp.]|nr:hypothetical protein [Sporichthya sp.]